MTRVTHNVSIDQDLIVEMGHSPIFNDLFSKVLNISPGECLLTDQSSLSDFVGQGMPEPSNALQLTYEAYLDAWDQWVLKRVEAEFGVRLENTTMTLLQVMDRLQKSGERTVH